MKQELETTRPGQLWARLGVTEVGNGFASKKAFEKGYGFGYDDGYDAGYERAMKEMEEKNNGKSVNG